MKNLSFLFSLLVLSQGVVFWARGGCPPPPSSQQLLIDEYSGSKYRKIGLNGRPLSDEKPQAKEETDAMPEETYVDALTLDLVHSTTDIYIPVPNSELALEVKRSLQSDCSGKREASQYLPEPYQSLDRPFGTCWRSPSLAPNVVLSLSTSGPQIIKYIASDESGSSFRFGETNSTDIVSNRVLNPVLSNQSGAESIGTALEREAVGGGAYRFVLHKRYGSKVVYTSTGITFVSSLTGPNASYSIFWRADYVEDRFGNRLLYSYPSAGTMLPSQIQVQYSDTSLGPKLTIARSGERVTSITDPKGNVVNYSYDSVGRFLTAVSKHPSSGVDSNTSYEYTTYFRSGPGGIYTFWNVAQIKDALNHGYNFVWDTLFSGVSTSETLEAFLSRPRRLDSITLPDSNAVHFKGSFGSFPSNSTEESTEDERPRHRVNQVIDAKGNSVVYEFDDAAVWDGPHEVSLTISEDVFYRTAKIYYYSGSDLTFSINATLARVEWVPGTGTTLLGSEKFEFLIDSNMAPWKVTDFSGNVTQFEYGDKWSIGDYFRGTVGGTLPNVDLFYDSPTKETNALGGVKEFTYESTWRQMASIKDQLGRKTEYTFDTLGRRTKEIIKDADTAHTVLQETDFEYTNTVFKNFMTKKTVKKLGTSDPSWVTDLATQYIPDSNGRIWKEVTDPAGLALTTESTYDDDGNKLTSKDPLGNITTFAYDGMNRLVTTTFADASHKDFVYDLRGNKVKESDENGNATLFTYDSMNRLSKQARDMNAGGTIDSSDLVTEMTYDSLGSKLTQKDSNGNVTSFEYDPLQRLVKQTAPSPLSYVTTFVYGANSGGSIFDVSGFKPTQSVDARNLATKVTYDALYRPIKKEMEYATGVFAVTEMTYDAAGNLLTEKDPLGIYTDHDYDGLNRATKIHFAAGTLEESTQELAFTTTGLSMSKTDEMGRTTSTEYDAAGRPVYVVSPEVPWVGTVPSPSRAGSTGFAHAVTQTIYDVSSNVVGTINPLGKQWDFTFDSRNRKTKEEQPSVFDAVAAANARPTIQTEYDVAGRVTKVTDARGNETETEYDVANRVLKVKSPAVPLPGGGTGRPETVSTYDKNGNVLTLTDANAHTTTNVYDVLNRLLTSTDAKGIVVANEYDSAGNKITITDGKGQRSWFEYDGLNRNTRITYCQATGDKLTPGSTSTVYQFNALYKTKRTDEKLQETNYSYDARGRLIFVDYNSTNTAVNSDRTYVYDLAGNLLSVTEPGKGTAADVGYAYDDMNRVTAESSGGFTHVYAYDLASNRMSTVYGGTSRTLVSTYDDLNRLHTMTEGTAVTIYSYDLNGNIVKLALPNADLTTKTYDALNRVSAIETKTAGTTLLSTYTQTYDKVGNLVRVVEDYASGGLSDRTIDNTYDEINRLIQESTTTGSSTVTTAYEFDSANNRTKRTVNGTIINYTYNNLNQVKIGGRSYGFDANGNRWLEQAGKISYVYSYDFENRLVGLTFQTAPGAGTYAYIYDYRTRRVSRSETPHGGSTTVTKIIFSGGTSVQEYTVGSTTTLGVEYIRGSDYGGGVGGILYSLRGGTPSYTHYNNRGDVVAKTSATGSLTYEASYQAYGKRTAETGSTQDRQKANTKDEDPTGLLNEGFRYRDLETGTFITRDPLGFVDGPNMYAYVVQNPWTKFDPEGLSAEQAAQVEAVRNVYNNIRSGFGLSDTTVGKISSKLNSLTPLGSRMQAAGNSIDQTLSLARNRLSTGSDSVPASLVGARMDTLALNDTPVISSGYKAATGNTIDGNGAPQKLGTLDRVAEGGKAAIEAVAIGFGVRGGSAEVKPGGPSASQVNATTTAEVQTVVRTTADGQKGVRITNPDGTVIDISPKRVKEFVPNTHPKAPPGTLDKVKFDNALPGSKGYKRAPTAKDLDRLNQA